MGGRLCKHLKTQANKESVDMAAMMESLGAFVSSMPKSCVRDLWTKRPMAPDDILKVAKSSMMDKFQVSRSLATS